MPEVAEDQVLRRAMDKYEAKRKLDQTNLLRVLSDLSELVGINYDTAIRCGMEQVLHEYWREAGEENQSKEMIFMAGLQFGFLVGYVHDTQLGEEFENRAYAAMDVYVKAKRSREYVDDVFGVLLELGEAVGVTVDQAFSPVVWLGITALYRKWEESDDSWGMYWEALKVGFDLGHIHQTTLPELMAKYRERKAQQRKN